MEEYFNYILFWVCICGLCLGSFYNVVILRSLNNESIVFPPSKCPKCNHKLFWWHNIPLLSYLLLRGKCYFCKEKISVQYPIIEFVTMILFAIAFIKFKFSIKTLFVMFWCSGLIIMSVTDLKEKLVDCNIAIAMAISGFIFAYITTGTCLDSLYGLITSVFILELIARSGYLFAGMRAMGEADTYVAGALGAIFGFQNLYNVLLYSLIASMIFIIPYFFYKQLQANNKLLCITSILFILMALVLKTIANNFIILFIFIVLGILLAILVIKSMKENEPKICLPFVPALTLGALTFLFL